jgi:hypothetical protein
MLWRRKPALGQATVTLTKGELAVQELNAEYPHVVLRGRARRHHGDWLVSLFLVNAQQKPSGRGDAYWLFQVERTLTTPLGDPVTTLRRTGAEEDPERGP